MGIVLSIVIGLTSAAEAPPGNEAEALFKAGEGHFRKGQDAFTGKIQGLDPGPDLREAAKAFEDIGKRFPKEEKAAQGTLFLGTTYLLLDEMEKALAAYQRVYDEYPAFKDRPLALYRVAVCQAGLDDPGKAKASFQKFLQEFPDRTSEVPKVRKSLVELSIVGKPAPPLDSPGWLLGGMGKDGLKGIEGQVVVLVFFATWCPNCLKELPHLRSLMKRWESKDVVFLGVANPDDPQSTMPIETYVEKHNLRFFDVALDKGGRSSGPYRATAFPASAVIDRKGTVRWRGHLAFFSTHLVEKLLQEKG